MRLFFLGLMIRCRESLETFRVLWRYSTNPFFLRAFLWLKLYYLFDEPYTVSRRYLKKRCEVDVYQYGETPLTIMAELFGGIEVGGQEHVYELGAGSGFTSLWFHTVLGAKVTAVEQIPVFCQRLSKVIDQFGLDICVRQESYQDVDLTGATLLYLYASNLEDDQITRLVSRLIELPEGTRIVSVSYPLQPYIPRDNTFQILNRKVVCFPWGEAEVFLQVRTSD